MPDSYSVPAKFRRSLADWPVLRALSAFGASVVHGMFVRGRQSERAEHLAMAFAAADLGVWEWRIDGRSCIADPRTEAMLGRTGRMPTPCWTDLVHADDAARVQALLEEHFAGASTLFSSEHRLRKGDGEWVWIQSRGKVVQRDHRNAPLRMVGTHMDISERKLAEAEMRHLAFYDGLTDLPNRRLLHDRLGQAVSKSARGGQHGALLFIDLDNFKTLNDTLGHDMGDQLLRRVAQRLQQQMREADTVSRWGGDEFVVLLEQLGSGRNEAALHAGQKARAILRALGQAYMIDGHTLHSTPSIGVTLFGPEASSPESLLRQADRAMYQAKNGGRNSSCFFDRQTPVNTDDAAGAHGCVSVTRATAASTACTALADFAS